MANELDGRHRDEDGRISEKHGNTKVGELRRIYGEDFLSGWRSDAHLETVLQETGLSVSQMAKDPKYRQK